MKKLKIAILFLICLTCSSAAWPVAQADFKILYVGNSLTYTNNLPKIVEEMAKKKGIRIKTKMIALPNYALEDHWIDGNVQKEIIKNNYDIVIAQQGPSSQAAGRKMLMEYGKKFSDLCAKHGAKMAYLMVWPSLTYYQTFDGVIKNYKDASEKHDATLFPVGEVWKEYFNSTGKYDFYSSDGFHPSLKGSRVAAEIIVKKLIIIKNDNE